MRARPDGCGCGPAGRLTDLVSDVCPHAQDRGRPGGMSRRTRGSVGWTYRAWKITDAAFTLRKNDHRSSDCNDEGTGVDCFGADGPVAQRCTAPGRDSSGNEDRHLKAATRTSSKPIAIGRVMPKPRKFWVALTCRDLQTKPLYSVPNLPRHAFALLRQGHPILVDARPIVQEREGSEGEAWSCLGVQETTRFWQAESEPNTLPCTVGGAWRCRSRVQPGEWADGDRWRSQRGKRSGVAYPSRVLQRGQQPCLITDVKCPVSVGRPVSPTTWRERGAKALANFFYMLKSRTPDHSQYGDQSGDVSGVAGDNPDSKPTRGISIVLCSLQ